MYQEGGSATVIKTIAVPFHKKVLLAFSPEGKYLAMYHKHKKEQAELLLYQIDHHHYEFTESLSTLLEKIEAEEVFASSSIEEIQDTKKMEFTRNDQFLAVYGHYKGTIFNVDKMMEKEQSFTIEGTKFKVIFDLEIQATGDG